MQEIGSEGGASNQPHRRDRRQATSAQEINRWLIGLGALTVGSVGTLLVVHAVGGEPAIRTIVQGGHEPNLYLTLHAVILTWLLFTISIAVVRLGWVNASNGFVFAGAICVSLLYINVLREWPVYGDLNDYIVAAERLQAGLPLPARYLYPPLWATILASLLPLGSATIFHVAWGLNVISLIAFYVLLQRALVVYGFESNTAAVVCLLFCVVNVPVLRTLGYGQINLHVMNLMLISLLCYPRHRVLSAVALGVAANLKISPLVLALPFALRTDLRWLAWFVAGLGAVAALPMALYGTAPYHDVVDNLRHVYTANRLAFRDNSFDSFFRAIVLTTGRTDGWTPVLVAGTKAVFAAACLATSLANARRRIFASGDSAAATVLNMAPALLVLLVMVSPLVWEHHPVFLALSYLVVIPLLHTRRQLLWYALAYYLEFMMPTFDAFPWSYGRLASPIILLSLMWLMRTRVRSRALLRIEQVFGGTAPPTSTSPTVL